MTAVVVVGGGLAGIWAAVSARRRGAQVILVSRAPGATALYGGGMQIAPQPGPLLAGDRHHPFSRLYKDHRTLEADLEAVTADLATALGRIGLPMVRPEASARYADLHGTPRSAQVVPATVAPGELSQLRGRRVAVAAVEGIGDYDAEATMGALREMGISASVVAAPMKELPVGAAVGDLYGRSAPTVDAGSDLIAFPPGFVKLPPNGFELLASVPSAHGWRLHNALERIVEAEGVTRIARTVTGFTTRDDRVTAAVTAEGEIAGDAFVLATGRYIGGGLVKTRMVSEPLLDLGVFHEGEPIHTAYPRLRHLEYIDPAPALRTGLMTDSELRPLAVDNRPPYANLRVAGSVLGGYDYASGGCGFGVPLLTGWLAGLRSLT